jgi:hypothetical protein
MRSGQSNRPENRPEGTVRTVRNRPGLRDDRAKGVSPDTGHNRPDCAGALEGPAAGQWRGSVRQLLHRDATNPPSSVAGLAPSGPRVIGRRSSTVAVAPRAHLRAPGVLVEGRADLLPSAADRALLVHRLVVRGDRLRRGQVVPVGSRRVRGLPAPLDRTRPRAESASVELVHGGKGYRPADALPASRKTPPPPARPPVGPPKREARGGNGWTVHRARAGTRCGTRTWARRPGELGSPLGSEPRPRAAGVTDDDRTR